jgi:hypothetical protein
MIAQILASSSVVEWFDILPLGSTIFFNDFDYWNYTISGASGNYTIDYISGTLTVLRRLTVMTANESVYAGAPLSVFTGSNNMLPQDSALFSWTYALRYRRRFHNRASVSYPRNRLANSSVTLIDGTLTANQIPSTVLASSAYAQSSDASVSANSGALYAYNSSFASMPSSLPTTSALVIKNFPLPGTNPWLCPLSYW